MRLILLLVLLLAAMPADAPSECSGDAECAERFGGNGDPE